MKPVVKQLHFGASFYPEHWDEARWAEDIRLMKVAYVTVVRMGEFGVVRVWRAVLKRNV